MAPLFAYTARVRQSGRIWEGFCRGGASHYERKAQGRHGHKGLKPESVDFWHNAQNRLKKKKKKTCGKRLQTDFSVRQVPALPSAFSFTSQSVCSQQIPSIHPSLALLLPLPPHQFDTLAMCSVCYTWQDYMSSRSLEDIKNQKDFFYWFQVWHFWKILGLTAHVRAHTHTHTSLYFCLVITFIDVIYYPAP